MSDVANEAGSPAATAFPRDLKTIAIVVSVLKAIPLVIFFGFLIWLSANLDRWFDGGQGIDGPQFLLLLLAIFVLGAALLVFQLLGTLRGNRRMLLVSGGILAIIDVAWSVASWRESAFQGIGGALTITAAAVLQISIVVKAWRHRP